MNRNNLTFFVLAEFCQCQEPAWKSFLKFYNPSCPIPGRRGKIKLNFYFQFSLWCLKRFYEGLKGFMKALKAFIKPLGGTQRSGKIKSDFYFNTTFRNAQDGKGYSSTTYFQRVSAYVIVATCFIWIKILNNFSKLYNGKVTVDNDFLVTSQSSVRSSPCVSISNQCFEK